MYFISILVYSTNNDYNLKCYSNAIQIISAIGMLPTYDSTSQPDYTIKFNGQFSSINPVEIKTKVYNYMTTYGINIGGIKCYAGSVIVAFYSTDTNTQLINSLTSGGLNISSNLVFVSANIGGTMYNCTNCIIITNNNNVNTNNTNNSSNNGNANNPLSNNVQSNNDQVLNNKHIYFIKAFNFNLLRLFQKTCLWEA